MKSSFMKEPFANSKFAVLVILFSINVATRLPAQVQPVCKTPTPARVSAGDITDIRTTGAFASECKVELKFTGDAAADAGAVRAVRLTEAIDELGRDLRPPKTDDAPSLRESNFGHVGSLRTELKLRNPSRNAALIKSLKGEVELFCPSASNGGILTIKDILRNPAEPVKNPALAKYGISLVYLTKQSYEAKKKELEEQRKAGGSADDNKLGDAFGELFKGMFSGMMSSSSKDALQLYVKDPEKRVIALEFQDAQGKPLKTRSRWSSGEFQQTELAGAPPPDTQLTVQLAVPEAVRTFPFELRDIPLP